MGDISELAQLMLDWEKQSKKLREIEEEIERAVLEIGKTFTVGNVRASYTKGRSKYDYKSAFEHFRKYTTIDEGELLCVVVENTREVVDYKSVCQRFNVDGDLVSKSEPSVKIKLLD